MLEQGKEKATKMYRLFYRGLRICTNNNEFESRMELLNNCKVAPLKNGSLNHLLISMHK